MILVYNFPVFISADPQKQTEADRIKAAWSQSSQFPSVAEVRSAALLAQEGYLTSVKRMYIGHMDISDIPSDHLGKLASIVTERVYIWSMTPNSQLGSILASVQCYELALQNMDLNEADTRALVTAMSHRLDLVLLSQGVTLDLDALTAYDGRGHCTRLEVVGDTTLTRYREQIKTWAREKEWTVTRDDDGWGLRVQRK